MPGRISSWLSVGIGLGCRVKEWKNGRVEEWKSSDVGWVERLKANFYQNRQGSTFRLNSCLVKFDTQNR